jgi:hypothetical protein
MFNPVISIVRVFSMLLIVVTHFLTWMGINSFQISTVGVASFLFISGYLYGNKSIDNRKDWIKNRINRVLVPFWILASALSFYLIIKGDYQLALKQIIESFFNLQGIRSIICISFGIGNGHLSGLAHCWFLTVIMLCYIGIVFLKNSCVEKFGDMHSRMLFLFSIFLHIAFCFINVAIGCFVIFFIGYFYRRLESTSKTSNSFFALITFATLVVVSIRIVLKKFIDGECFYDFFIASFSSNICAIWCFVLVKWVSEKYPLLAAITVKKSWKQVDNMTYPLYLTHYMFLKEPFALPPQMHICASIISFTILSIVSAMLLDVVTKKIQRK